MASKEELLAQLAEIQAQLDSAQDWAIGEEVFTSKGLAKVIQFYTEDGVEKIQVEMTQLDSRDGLTLLDHTFLMSMPPEHFKKIIKDHQSDQKLRDAIAEQEATKAHFAEFLRWKKAQEQQKSNPDDDNASSAGVLV